jgi:hypothetical protein
MLSHQADHATFSQPREDGLLKGLLINHARTEPRVGGQTVGRGLVAAHYIGHLVAEVSWTVNRKKAARLTLLHVLPTSYPWRLSRLAAMPTTMVSVLMGFVAVFCAIYFRLYLRMVQGGALSRFKDSP